MFYLEKRHKRSGRSRQLIKWTTYGFIQMWFEKRLETTFDACLVDALVMYRVPESPFDVWAFRAFSISSDYCGR